MASYYQNFAKKWIGEGVQSPDSFNQATGGVNTNSGPERIHQSIYYILSTTIGERFFVPDFGSKLSHAIFEPNDYILSDLIQVYVKEALGKWEPRIEVLGVNVQFNDSNTVPVLINFRIRSSNMVDNYVYPFQRMAMQLGGESSNASK